jgi:hypothetical protein
MRYETFADDVILAIQISQLTLLHFLEHPIRLQRPY